MFERPIRTAGFLLFSALGCGSTSTDGEATGGKSSGGSGAATGGADVTGGNSASGGATGGGSTGGRPNAAGGNAATGGRPNATGGNAASGGRPNATGGNAATGGNTTGGAAPSTGGRSSGLVDCDQRKAACLIVTPSCPAGQVPSIVGACFGPCVKIESCACSAATDCPDNDQYTCWSRMHCGPYVD
jgi:hypothetical protein